MAFDFQRSATVFLVATMMLGFTVGCRPAAAPPDATASSADPDQGDHDHDEPLDAAALGLDADDLVYLDQPDAPESLADAVNQLVALRDVVAEGFAEDNVDAIHDQLHDVGGLLEATETLLDNSDVDESTRQSASQAINTLFEAYGQVDEKLHGGSGKDYQDVSDSIDSAIESLKPLASQP